MDTSLLLSIIGIVLSTIATAISSILVFRQASFQRHANQLPIVVNLLQEYRSASFQNSQEYVKKSLSSQHDASIGVSNLPKDARTHVICIGGFFSSLDVLIAHGIANENLVVSLFGYPARANWEILQPYISRERELRSNGDFFNYYEDLVCRVRDNWPPVSSYDLKLRKLGQST